MSAALTTNVDQRLLRTTKFPPEFNVKVDMRKVHTDLIKGWVESEIAKILKSEDDVVTDLVKNILDESRFPNIKELQIALTGFLDKDAASFCENLWRLCLSAQESPQGVPRELIEAKKADLLRENAEKQRQRDEVVKRQEAERERDRETARIRDRERSERGRGRDGRNSGDFGRRGGRDSRSPPRRRNDDDDFHSNRTRTDTYIPPNVGGGPPRRRRSPSYGRYSSRSRSPPPPRRRRRVSSPSRSPPPRKRRNTSSDDTDRVKNGRKGGEDRRERISYHPRRRSPSTRRSRSPPTKRNRRASPSPERPSTSDSRSTNQSAAPRKKKELGPNDLMAADKRKERPDNLRLSREESTSRSETPLSTKGGADPSNPTNLLREKQLKELLMARQDLRRKDSVIKR